jgi:hypothetical protein
MPARVKVNVGYTVNMGDFESLRLDFGIEDDTRENEKATETFDRCFKFVWTRLEAEVDKAKRAARG